MSQAQVIEHDETEAPKTVQLRTLGPTTPMTLSPMELVSRAVLSGASIEMVKQMLDLQERLEAKEAKKLFDDAMAEAQAEMKPVAKNLHNKQTNSQYAGYDALDEAVKPIYTKHGFSVSFYPGDGAPPGDVRVFCKVRHNGGRTEESHLDMPADGKGAKGGDVMTRTHATGSALKYGMRYLLTMVFNISTRNAMRDDDGNAAARTSGPISREQYNEICQKSADAKVSPDRLLKWVRTESQEVESIDDIPARRFDQVIAMLEQKRLADTERAKTLGAA